MTTFTVAWHQQALDELAEIWTASGRRQAIADSVNRIDRVLGVNTSVKMSILDLHCLNAVTDDHESATSILEEVRRTSHGNVCWSEVVASLAEMTAAGLLAAYSLLSLEYWRHADPLASARGFRDSAHKRVFQSPIDPRGSRFEPVDPTGKDPASLWFRITPAGLAELEANWVDE